jgi:hypothetical protein
LGLLGLGAAPPADMRTDMEAVGLALDRAVLQVSRPSRAATPRGTARGYRLEGFGAMFVLAPRALPVPPPTPTPEERESVRALSEAAQELEQRLQGVLSDDVRFQLQQMLRAMRQTEAGLRLRDKMGRRAAGEPVAPEGAASAAPRTLEDTLLDLERDVQAMQQMQSEALQSVPDDRTGLPPELRRDIEFHMRLVNQQAFAFAAEAERARQEAERAIWIRLGQQPPSPDAPGAVPSTNVSASAGAPPPDVAGQVVPPWVLWTNDPIEDPTPDPQAVIQGVGAAVTSVLEAHGARLRILAPQEVVAVAIDFIPATRMGQPARTARTLVVRARKADIDLRAAGQISPAEFRKRVELVEY